MTSPTERACTACGSLNHQREDCTDAFAVAMDLDKARAEVDTARRAARAWKSLARDWRATAGKMETCWNLSAARNTEHFIRESRAIAAARELRAALVDALIKGATVERFAGLLAGTAWLVAKRE